MKRLQAAVLVGIILVAGCRGRGGEGEADGSGLITVRVLGVDKEVTVAGKSLKLSDWYTGKVKSRLWDAFVGELASRGVRLELDLIMSDQMATAFQTTLAAGKLNDYDMVTLGGGHAGESLMYRLYKQGRFYPIDKAVEEYSQGPARDYYFNNANGIYFRKMETLEDGSFYWLPGVQENYYKDPSYTVSSVQAGMIRQDWLDALGLPMPATLEEFYTTLTAFREEDMNRNGVKDEAAQISMEGFMTGVAQWFGLGEGLVTAIDEKVTSPWYQEHIKDYIAYMKRLYAAGLIQVGSEGGDSAANRIGYTQDWVLETWLEPGISLPPEAAPASYVPFVIQATEDNPARVWMQAGRVINWTPTFIPAKAKHVEGAVRVIDFLVTQAYSDLTEHGIEGYTYRYDNGVLKEGEDNPDNVGLDVELVRATHPGLWCNGAIVPRHSIGDAYDEIPKIRNDGYPLKADFIERAYAKTYPFIMDLNSYAAFPLADELKRIGAITPDLSTYSAELLTGLIMGGKSMDKWDLYQSDLKRLGLDELIAIYQARLDRALH